MNIQLPFYIYFCSLLLFIIIHLVSALLLIKKFQFKKKVNINNKINSLVSKRITMSFDY